MWTRCSWSQCWFGIRDYNLPDLTCKWCQYVGETFASILCAESVIIWNSKPKSSAATSCFCIYDHPGGHLFLMHTFINWTAVSLRNPPSCTSKQTVIYNSHDLWPISVLKYRRLLKHSFFSLFFSPPARDKVKLDVDAWDDFIQNLLMCFLCTINLKPLGVSWQSVASAAPLLLGDMISCFVNCRDSDTCILMAVLECPRILTNAKTNNCWMFCGTNLYHSYVTATSLKRQEPTDIFESMCTSSLLSRHMFLKCSLSLSHHFFKRWNVCFFLFPNALFCFFES